MQYPKQTRFAKLGWFSLTGFVMFDPVAIGKRIAEARKRKQFDTPGALAAKLDVSRQAVSHWEAGHIPSWDMLGRMVQEFEPEDNEEWIMFGVRRAEQLERDGYVLSWLSPEEARIIQAIRRTNQDGQKATIINAEANAQHYPATGSVVQPIRKQEDLPQH